MAAAQENVLELTPETPRLRSTAIQRSICACLTGHSTKRQHWRNFLLAQDFRKLRAQICINVTQQTNRSLQ
jgi:hypothetical protein